SGPNRPTRVVRTATFLRLRRTLTARGFVVGSNKPEARLQTQFSVLQSSVASRTGLQTEAINREVFCLLKEEFFGLVARFNPALIARPLRDLIGENSCKRLSALFG